MSDYMGDGGGGIACETCLATGGFYVDGGVTFCRYCGNESQQHGYEMVVDEEAAVFHGGL